MPWQLRALSYYDQIGELRFGSHFIARMMSRVRYFPAYLSDDGTLEEIKEGLPVDVLHRIQDPGGGRSQLQYRYGLLQFVTGEGVLFGYRLEEPDQRWKFLWKDEVKIEDGVAIRLDANRQETADRGVAYRMWTPHPRHSDEADSPVRAIMDICEELLILTLSVRSTAVSRMTNGVMVMPLEAIPVDPDPAEPQGDEDAENNVFLQDYIEHMQNQIENPGSASAQAAFLYTPPYEYADRFSWVKTHDPATDYMEKELRTEAIKRMALGMDMPPEALLGMTDANHWTAKQVMHDMWRSHGIPKAEQFADDVSEAYERPALRDADFPDWERVVIAVDDSQVVISPDRTEDADKALDRIAIGFPGYRELKGIREDMAPTEEERAFLASLKLRQPVELEDGELVLPQSGPVASTDASPSAEDGPATPSASRNGSRQEAMSASARIYGAAELALLRCRELAGIRIRHKCKTCAEGSPDALVASVMGPAQVREPMTLVRGGADGLRSLLGEWGFAETQASSLCQMLEVYAAKTLFDARQPELPSGFMAQVEKAEEVSYALVDH